jgi:hypothetical protein
MVSNGKTITIAVDPQVAEILRRASALASASGETLGAYLLHSLPPNAIGEKSSTSQRQAWDAFVTGMASWSKSNLPTGYVADDSRDSIYDDRN